MIPFAEVKPRDLLRGGVPFGTLIFEVLTVLAPE